MSLVAERKLASPVSVVAPGLFEVPVASAFAVEVSETRIDWNGVVMNWRDTPRWQPIPRWASLAEPQADYAARFWRAHERSNCGSAERVAANLDLRLVDAFAATLIRAEADDARSLAARLIGRGPGLTPSGDDALLGALHALWALRPSATAKASCAAVLEGLLGNTTSLAGAWLKAAIDGEAVAPWHSLVDALAGGRDEALTTAVAGVAEIGATSGRAMLAGFDAVLRSA